MKSTKIFLFATIISLLGILTTSCTPDTQNQPLPANTFEVNISVLSGYTPSDTIKTIVVDGDSVRFNLLNSEDWVVGPGTVLTLSVNAPNYEVLRVKTYPFNSFTNVIDSTYSLGNIDVINGRVLLNNSYTSNAWDTTLLCKSGDGKHFRPIRIQWQIYDCSLARST